MWTLTLNVMGKSSTLTWLSRSVVLLLLEAILYLYLYPYVVYRERCKRRSTVERIHRKPTERAQKTRAWVMLPLNVSRGYFMRHLTEFTSTVALPYLYRNRWILHGLLCVRFLNLCMFIFRWISVGSTNGSVWACCCCRRLRIATELAIGGKRCRKLCPQVAPLPLTRSQCHLVPLPSPPSHSSAGKQKRA